MPIERGERWLWLGSFGVPPVLDLRRQRDNIERRDERIAAVALSNNFDAVGRVASGREIHNIAATDASPAGFLAAPLQATAGPGQLFTVIQSTARPHDAIGQVGPRTLKNMSRRPGMLGVGGQ